VRDKHGKVVGDLGQGDFVLEENGQARPIQSFARQTDMPLALGLVVDTASNQSATLDQERSATGSFVEQFIREDRDKAFLIHFDREVELLQDLTSHHDKLEAALDLLKTPDRDRSNDSNESDSRSGSDRDHQRGGTQLYDAVYLASTELLKKQTGRKAVVILSDGVDRGSKTTLESAIESAQRADTIVYCIYFAGHHEEHGDRGNGGRTGRSGGGWPGGGWPGGGGYPGGGGRRGGGQRPSEEPRVDGKKILQRVSKETGGRFFEASKKESVGEIYTSIAEELRTQYSLGYTPDKESSASGYHHLQLQVKRKDTTVQTRDGYYGYREN